MMGIGAVSGGPSPQRAAAEKTAREFEAVFAGAIAKLMIESVEVGEDFSGGHGEAIFRGVLAEQLGTEMTKRGGLGIAPAVLEQILRMQGEQP